MESPQTIPEAQALPYATPVPATSKRVWAGIAVLVGGLAMIGLGGCFLIGVLFIYVSTLAAPGGGHGQPATLGSIILSIVLYILAGGCFIGAVTLIVISVRWLKAIVFG